MSKQDPFGFRIRPINLGTSNGRKKRDKRRSFTRTQKNEIWAQQDGKCAKCHKKLDLRTVEYDHIKAWASRGRTITENGAALCPHCHKLKTHKSRLKKIDRKKEKPKQVSPFNFRESMIDFGI